MTDHVLEAPGVKGTKSISASTSSARTARAVGSSGPVEIFNATSAIAFLKAGDVTVTAAVTDYPIPAGESRVVDIGAHTNLAAILASGTGTVYFTEFE
ncbi:hypothetical protein JN531_001385 [Flagellatimonas centrodinii]|uniref:hypothetical protein n=1 Tax=Flagellatimonas centrodinii TaxID=2806210 RepID=UPI001FED9538|nr:hypothetical protein [Flagellatimonas centrodinii]ULQ46951.1 hypothetical protein JN531_001385 [Flagellatimonas centrodinii]